MLQNLELKLVLRDMELAQMVCRDLGATHAGVLEQVDTYFRVPHGRAKRRDTVGRPTEFVVYDRADQLDPRPSAYELLDDLAFSSRFGSPGAWCVVRKRRELWLIDETRIHLDRVDGLGDYCEFEVLMVPGRTGAQARAVLDRLRRALAPALGEPVPGSYSDLLGGT